MMTNSENKQIKFHMITIENLVPENHFLRKLNRLADFSFIREETKAFYCHNNGRPCIDPVVLVKYLLIGFLYGIESERRLEQEIQVNMAYRWFLGLDLDERVPDHSTLSQNPAQAVSLKGAVPNSVFADCPPMHGKGAGGWETDRNRFHPCQSECLPPV